MKPSKWTRSTAFGKSGARLQCFAENGVIDYTTSDAFSTGGTGTFDPATMLPLGD